MAIKMEHIVKRYYDELENGKIMGRKCPACGAVQFPPRIACTTCGHFDQEWVEMSGDAVLTDITIPSRMTGPSTDVFKPFVMGCFKMKEGAEINGILRNVSHEDAEELKQRLPIPVTASIFQIENQKTVVFELK
ncbi:MAG: zinc ribbon domain-containing protein [Clostridiales bacterium]|nr:zinc ribbon domain-containing protein [Clostridiales bacterium]MDY3745571.1 zinc ribbon domain-containing protein [Lachnospiraceae bacterium]